MNVPRHIASIYAVLFGHSFVPSREQRAYAGLEHILCIYFIKLFDIL